MDTRVCVGGGFCVWHDASRRACNGLMALIVNLRRHWYLVGFCKLRLAACEEKRSGNIWEVEMEQQCPRKRVRTAFLVIKCNFMSKAGFVVLGSCIF